MDGLSPLPLTASRISFYLYLVLTVLAAASVMLSGISLLLKILLILLLLLLVCMPQSTPPAHIGCSTGQWWMQERSGPEPVHLVLCGDVLVLAWLVVVKFRRCDNGKTITFALWPDSADSEDLRRLRVFLRYGKMQSLFR